MDRIDLFIKNISIKYNAGDNLDDYRQELKILEFNGGIKNPYRYIKSDNPNKPYIRMVSKIYYDYFMQDDEYDTENQD